MTKTLLITALGASVLLLAGCKKKPDVKVTKTETVTIAPADTAVADTTENVTGFTKAQYMTACQQAMTETQCECYVDFYKSIGLKVTDLGDSAKVTAAVTKNADKAAEMAKCMQ